MTTKKLFTIAGVIVVLVAIISGVMFMKTLPERKLRNAEKLQISDLTVFNEDIDIKYDDTLKHKLTLVNSDTKEETAVSTGANVNNGIEMTKFDEGTYYLKDGDKYLTKDKFKETEFYTITRKKTNYKITISVNPRTDVLEIEKKKEKLPDDVYDIIIDPGHGGDDVGSIGADGTYEKDLALQISEKLKTGLEDAGYKVAITRESDINPGNIPDLEEYGKGSRVGLSYEKHAKIFLSMHYNTGYGSGYEIYSSVATDDEFSNYIADEINKTLSASTKISDGSNGLYKRDLYTETLDPADKGTDYYFGVREIGGRSVKSFAEKNQYRKNTVGAEGIIFESGYIDNQADLDKLKSTDTMDEEVKDLVNAVNNYVNR